VRTAEEACIEYAIASADVRAQSRILRAFPCDEANNRHWNETGEQECLTQYWTTTRSDTGPIPDPQIDYDNMCDNCKKREQAYRDRAQGRKRLGAAKRSIEAVGKRLNKEATP
jgi:hypothetical protein